MKLRPRKMQGGEEELADSPTYEQHAISIDRNDMQSVLRFLPWRPDFDGGGRRKSVIPTPAIFKQNPTPELRELRSARIWYGGTRDQQVKQMKEWFPDIRTATTTEVTTEATVLDSTPTLSSAASDIGTLAKLPGELRNRIYRFAVLGKEAAKFVMKPETCAKGLCQHSRATNNAPGIANTCRQLRHEVMPIFCAENDFSFDAGMVQHGCVGNLLRSLGGYVGHVPQYTFTLQRPVWKGTSFGGYKLLDFTLASPLSSKTGRWELSHIEQQVQISFVRSNAQVVCQCKLDRYVHGMRMRFLHTTSVGSLGKEALQFTESDEFVDFAYGMRASKLELRHLKVCKTCRKVRFHH